MKSYSQFKEKIKFVLTDIDDTLTDHGLLKSEAYKALWDLKKAGVHVIPITGRPAGWCEMIARLWPVSGIVGENGGFYFRYHQQKMKREFYFDEATRKKNRLKLDQLESSILSQVPGSALASDQFCRLMDLAIDFCEDVPALPQDQIKKIVTLFEEAGAQAKVSSIHVNGWFGEYDKLSMTLRFLQKEFSLSAEQAKMQCAFCGDSPNDEPMFAYFPNSFGVANIKKFTSQIQNLPHYVADLEGGAGFKQITEQILLNQ